MDEDYNLNFLQIFNSHFPDKSIKVKARVNPQGYMGSSTRIERPKKGKGSYNRKPKHKEAF